MAKDVGSIPFRRSARIQARIPVTLSGTLADGKPFKEETYVITVSKFGGRLKTEIPLKVGAQVKLQPRNRSESAPFRVVWVGSKDTSHHGEIGVEYIKLSSLLGISFPG